MRLVKLLMMKVRNGVTVTSHVQKMRHLSLMEMNLVQSIFKQKKIKFLISKRTKNKQQAEAELGQTQPKLRLILKLEDFD